MNLNWMDLTMNLVIPSKDKISIPVLYGILVVLLVLSSVITFNTEVDAELDSLKAVDGSFMSSETTVKGVIAFAKLLLLMNPLAVSMFGLCLSSLLFKDEEPRYADMLSIVLRGEIVAAVGMVLIAPLIAFTHNVHVSFTLTPLMLKLGCKPSGGLFFLLSRLNLFFILEVVVVGLGLSRFYNCSTRKGLFVAVMSVGFFTILLVLIRLL